MRGKILLLTTLIVVILGLAAAYFMLTNVMNPNSIAITSTRIEEETILLKGTFMDSALNYSGYSKTCPENKLVLKIKGSLIKWPHSSGEFEIHIKNTCGDIHEIYLQGSDPNSIKLIYKSDH
ncbi:hypothetical protein [Paenibacillus sp. P22]|uniref:hypothetical protein n=1 Tax=Paenibacillus TaxID=44249 RepID=UPI00038F7EFF|nr:hypothetical protein [Paenibacillus sp. P22]CDN41161.1 Uncharacterized protein BN871_AC_00550 [Paenibacillus sp. P22]